MLLLHRNIDKLAEHGDVAALIKALRTHDPQTRGRAALALGHLGDPQALEPLMALLPTRYVYWTRKEAQGPHGEDFRGGGHWVGDPDQGVRLSALQAIGMLADPRALQDLVHRCVVDRTEGKTPELEPERSAAAAAVAATGAKHPAELGRLLAVQLAVGMSRPPYEPEACWLEVVRRLGTTGAKALLEAPARDRHEEDGIRVALRWLGTDARKPCMAAMRGKDPVARTRAAIALGKIGDRHAIAPLASYGEVVSLAELGGPDAFDALVELFHEGSVDVRSHVVQRIAQTADSRAVDFLLSILTDENKVIVNAAALQLLEQLLFFRHVVLLGRKEEVYHLHYEVYGLVDTPRPLLRGRNSVEDGSVPPASAFAHSAPMLVRTTADAHRVMAALDALVARGAPDLPGPRASSAQRRHGSYIAGCLDELHASFAAHPV